MGSTDYVEIPLRELVQHESGLLHRTDPTSPDSSSGGRCGKKMQQPDQSRSFARIMVSKSKREPPMKKSPFRMKRTASNAEMGLRSLRFLDKNGSKEGEGWRTVEKRFEQFAVAGFHSQFQY